MLSLVPDQPVGGGALREGLRCFWSYTEQYRTFPCQDPRSSPPKGPNEPVGLPVVQSSVSQRVGRRAVLFGSDQTWDWKAGVAPDGTNQPLLIFVFLLSTSKSPCGVFAFAQKKNKHSSSMKPPPLMTPSLKQCVCFSVYRLHRPFVIVNNTISDSGLLSLSLLVLRLRNAAGKNLGGLRLRRQRLGLFDLDLDLII